MKSNINETPLKSYGSIPKYWPLRPYTQLYNTLPESELIIDGWRDIINPQYNTETQKIGSLILVNDSVTYEVINLTQEEIEQRQQSQLDSDSSATALSEAISDGTIMFQRMFAYLQRQFDNGNITATEAKNSAQRLFTPLLPINYGQFQLAKINLNALTPPANQKELAILNLAKQQINEYINGQTQS